MHILQDEVISLKIIRNVSEDFGEILIGLKVFILGVPVMAQWKRIWLAYIRMQVRSLPSLSRLRIPHYHGLWCTSQTWLGSGVAMAVV